MLTFDEVYKVIETLNKLDEEFWVHASGGEVRVMLNMNDMFYWACADGEYVEIEDLPLLEQSYKEADDGALLYVARKRKMRPQLPVFMRKSEKDKELLSQCGPERHDY